MLALAVAGGDKLHLVIREVGHAAKKGTPLRVVP